MPKVSFKDSSPSPKIAKILPYLLPRQLLLDIPNRLAKLALSKKLGDCAFLEISTHLSPNGE